jgi:hypothetical protein
MKLADILASLESFDEALCIVARRPWTREAEAELVLPNEDGRLPAELLSEGFEYFLEVSIALHEVLSGPVPLSADQKVEAVIYYAEHDAFPDWLNELGSQR